MASCQLRDPGALLTRKQSAKTDYAEKVGKGEKGVEFTSGDTKSESETRKQSAKTDYAEKVANGQKGSKFTSGAACFIPMHTRVAEVPRSDVMCVAAGGRSRA